MKSSICTTIEQSKKLMELGLDVNSADMYWWNCHGFRLSANPYTEEVKKGFESHQLECIPAWSLSALLEIMPKLERIGYEKSYPKIIRHNFTNKFYGHCLHYDTDMFDKPIDAAFDMIVWLLEKRYIKTFKNKN